MNWYQRVGKRWFDVSVVLVTALLWLPVSLVVAVVVRITIGRPVLFRQIRPGYRGRPFRIYKFRTMFPSGDDAGRPQGDAERMTRVGAVLRRLSLDELPELISVLRGDMSLVGPRPLLMEYLDLYTPEQARRHDVRPGITGLAQTKGRNTLTWEDRFVLDVRYVDDVRLSVDLKVLWATLMTVATTRGVSAPDHVTMPMFRGGASE